MVDYMSVTGTHSSSSILPDNSTPRSRMVRPSSYSGAGGRDRVVGQWERKVLSAPKKPLRRMKIRGGGPSNRWTIQITSNISKITFPLHFRDFSGAQAEDKKPLLLPAAPLVSKLPNDPSHINLTLRNPLPSPQGVFSQATDLLLSWMESRQHFPTVTA